MVWCTLVQYIYPRKTGFILFTKKQNMHTSNCPKDVRKWFSVASWHDAEERLELEQSPVDTYYRDTRIPKEAFGNNDFGVFFTKNYNRMSLVTYNTIVCWSCTRPKTVPRHLNHQLQRIASAAITEAIRSMPAVALEVILDLIPRSQFIEAWTNYS